MSGNAEPVDTSHLIRDGDYCEIVSTQFKEDGLKRGNFVFVAGQRAFPVSEEDMYTQRIMFLCHKSDRKGVVDLSAGFYLIDPSSLVKLDSDKQEKMHEVLQEQIEASRLAREESPSEEVH